MLQQKVNGKVASLADELGAETAPYYQDIKSGKAKTAGLLKGNLEDVTFPLSIPDAINPLPNLKKVVGGKATNDRPQLHITADIKAPAGEGEKKITGWDWYAAATLDPFEHEDLPGYTFHAGDKVYIDHSSRENVGGMPAFPKDYDMAKAGLQGNTLAEWMGVYISELSMEFPKDIKVGNGK